MKLKLLLWMLYLLMYRGAKSNATFKKKIKDKNITFKIGSQEGIGRYYCIAHNAVKSKRHSTKSIDFSISFINANKGFQTLTAKNIQLAFMEAVQNKTVFLSGDMKQVLWFQQAVSCLFAKNKRK